MNYSDLKAMKTSKKSFGFTLFEALLVLTAIGFASLGVYKLFAPSVSQASVKLEQQNVHQMVEGLFDAYATASDFSSISTATTAGILGLALSEDNTLNTRVKVPLSVVPATNISPNDSFDFRYVGVPQKVCLDLIKALSPASSGVFIGDNASIQTMDGKIADENQIVQQCGANISTNVTFRFMGQKHTFTNTTMNACVCAPTSETQNVDCPVGSSGTITQRRTGLCTGGTPDCPTIEWSSWATTLNTCGVNSSILDPQAPATVVSPETCIPSVETQTVACPVGQVGGILQQRSWLCPANTWSSWMQVSSSCQADPTRSLCTPNTRQNPRACPAGQGGQEIVEQTSACDANGNKVWGANKLVSSTCTASCVTAGNCCVVSRQNQQVDRYCAAGQYGLLRVDQTRTSTCLTATSTPVWPSVWTDLRVASGICTSCPNSYTDTGNRSVPASEACPTGYDGDITWTSNQYRSRTVSYSCPAGTVVLPSPTYSSWSGWVETSRSNVVNNCTGKTCSGSGNQTQWVPTSNGTCPVGQNGTIVREKEQIQSRICDLGVWGAWGNWVDTSNTRVVSNTCGAAPTCSDPVAYYYYYNPDVLAAGVPALNHWNTFGYKEGRQSCWAPPGPSCTPPGPTSAAITRSVANENQTVACPAGQTGSITQTRTRTENGTRTTSWTCPGPTSSTTDTWLGTYNYGGWTTTSNTCVTQNVSYYWENRVIREDTGGTQSDRTQYQVFSVTGMDALPSSCWGNPPSGNLWTWRGSGYFPSFYDNRAQCACNASRLGWQVSWNQSEYFAYDEDYQLICVSSP